MAEELIIGTAGHVDHGKSTLIKALTGTDPDRLKEEKERGISIELGFAHFLLPSGKRAGIVDVPGHERFLRNMLAGVGSMDMVLLVIAADEGVMPQTREHLDILQLLGVEQGIVVITKADMVEEDWLDMIQEDIQAFLKGTVLEKAPVCRISAVKGQGLDELRQKIEAAAEVIKPRSMAGAFRLPIDRIFTLQGFGTVVAGTLWSGFLEEGDSAVIEPGGLPVRVRGIQVYGRKVKAARAGQRTAVNIAGAECTELTRGQVLAKEGALKPVRIIDGRLTLLKHLAKALRSGTRIRCHTGTAESIGRVYLLDQEELLPGDTGLVQIRLEIPIAPLYGDRYVLRLYSPMTTIGGGVILAVGEQKCRRFDEKKLALLAQKEKGQPEDLVYHVLAGAGAMLPAGALHKQLPQLTREEIRACLDKLLDQEKVSKWPIEDETYYLDKEHELGWVESLRAYLLNYHRQYPLRIGAPREEVRQKVMSGVSQRHFQALLETWRHGVHIDVVGLKLKLSSHEVVYQGVYKEWQEKIAGEFTKNLFTPPDIDAIIVTPKGKSKEAAAVWESLVERGEIVRVAEGIYFHREAVEKAKMVLAEYFQEHEKLTPADFRNLLGSSRKYTMPLLEYFDNLAITERHNEYRIQNAKNRANMAKT